MPAVPLHGAKGGPRIHMAPACVLNGGPNERGCPMRAKVVIWLL